MLRLAEGCHWKQRHIVEDDDLAWELILDAMDRWGDRKVPRDSYWPKAN